ncbi:MAG: HupE/UreJ family protein [Pseudomonadales bacterium]|nr:HupE/UreJ family protein [Pseudomonadales bacterium]
MSMVRLLTLVAVVGALAVQAHDARPNTVRILETVERTYSVAWKVPASLPVDSLPYPTLPADCETPQAPTWRSTGGAYLGQQTYRCTQGLAGRAVGIAYPGINPSLRTIYTVEFASGEEHLRILGPDEGEWVIPATPDPFAVAVEYTQHGVVHIWIGIDHLLFVACLLFIAGTPRRLLLTITGFTVAHSVTLALSALDLVHVPTPPVEAMIALSVVFLAWEIARDNPGSLTHRLPLVVSVAFGLLHGFGFATVLREVGLPSSELPIALLFFNVGVEIGQILFVLALVAGYAFLRALVRWRWGGESAPDRMRLAVPASYVIGTVASFWMIERVVGFWG